MYKVIFIDDEKYILDRIKTAIKWKDFGFELVDTFFRSEHITEYIEKNHVDVIITDIRMPNVSGLDIAKFCADNYPDIAVVILSAYQEFEYAQKAIKCNVFDYLTKPLQFSDIQSCLNKLKSQLDSKNKVYFSKNSEEKIVLQQTFLDIFYGNIKYLAELKSKIENLNLNIDIKKNACKIITIRINDYANYINKSWKYPLERLYNAINSFIPFETQDFYAVYLRYFLNYVEIFFIQKENCTDFDDCVKKTIKILKNNLKENINVSCEIKISEEYSSISSFVNSKTTPVNDEKAIDNEIIRKANEYIKELYSESITLKDAAKYVNLSYRYFGNYFKAHTGYNFLNFLNLYRLKKAVELMTDNTLTINSICDETGFSNQTYFYNLFKDYYNMSPKEYRNELMKKTSRNTIIKD